MKNKLGLHKTLEFIVSLQKNQPKRFSLPCRKQEKEIQGALYKKFLYNIQKSSCLFFYLKKQIKQYCKYNYKLQLITIVSTHNWIRYTSQIESFN